MVKETARQIGSVYHYVKTFSNIILKRVTYQSVIWGRSLKQVAVIPSLVGLSWERETDETSGFL